jgi:catechol 2,3-dioxygenase-like lactoylglutathione lyase family enzyme
MVRLGYVVLSCRDLFVTKRFYEVLGLRFQNEKHGNGPLHFSAIASGVVIELYPVTSGSEGAVAADPRRIGFAVSNPEQIAALLMIAGTPQISPRCFRDPDGRTIEIVQIES